MAFEENASNKMKSDDRCYTKCVLTRFIKTRYLRTFHRNFHIRK